VTLVLEFFFLITPRVREECNWLRWMRSIVKCYLYSTLADCNRNSIRIYVSRNVFLVIWTSQPPPVASFSRLTLLLYHMILCHMT